MNYKYRIPMGYIPAFDGLRAIAIVLVMLLHAHFFLGRNGQIGVSVFFTLSGFLITTLLLEEFEKNKKISVLGFYTRRIMRLFPALYLMLFMVLVYNYFFKTGIQQLEIYKEILSAALYLFNISWSWGWTTHNIILGHTWSLAVEEQFYLIWPFLLLAAIKYKKIFSFQFLLLIFIVTSLIFKHYNIFYSIINSIIQESIFIGCLAALLQWNYAKINIQPIISLICLLLIIIIGIAPIQLEFNIFNIVAVLTIILILSIVNNNNKTIVNTILSNKYLVFVGKISYSLYLWHVVIFRLFYWYPILTPQVSFITKFIITFIVASASWILLEKKATRLGRKWSDIFQKKTF